MVAYFFPFAAPPSKRFCASRYSLVSGATNLVMCISLRSSAARAIAQRKEGLAQLGLFQRRQHAAEGHDDHRRLRLRRVHRAQRRPALSFWAIASCSSSSRAASASPRRTARAALSALPTCLS